jgi:small-conductance mechanosensitive channel
MQNIVNNLVSGIIVAFEKPIEVGDVIEVGTRNGVVKNIGFRSSTITTYDGASVIIPNGDLISQQLINWTHSDRSRRVEIIVGVAYGTDVEKAIASANRALDGHEHIMRYPPPVVLVHQFAESSVDLRILFWTKDFDTWVQLKSEIMAAVYRNFAVDGMQIPFPQRDLHVKSLDPEVIKNLGKPPL